MAIPPYYQSFNIELSRSTVFNHPQNQIDWVEWWMSTPHSTPQPLREIEGNEDRRVVCMDTKMLAAYITWLVRKSIASMDNRSVVQIFQIKKSKNW